MYKILLYILNKIILVLMIISNLFISASNDVLNRQQNPEKMCENILFKDYMNIDIPENIIFIECKIKEIFPTYLTENQFHYKINHNYIELIKEYNDFPEKSTFNRTFIEIPCDHKESVCYEAIIYPYIHNIDLNTQTMKVDHLITGFKD